MAEGDFGIDPDILSRIMQIESGGNPYARTGSYKGLFQLSDNEFNRYGDGGNIFDPDANRRAAERKLSAERAAFKLQYGRDPTATDLYMVHQQGAGGYGQHMANPERPAWINMFNTAEGQQKGPNWAKQAIWGNVPDADKRRFGSVDNISSQDFVDLWRSKVEAGGETQGGSPAGLPAQAGDMPETGVGFGEGRKKMGVLDILSGGRSSNDSGEVGGLLGSLRDPSNLAALAMIVKGANPWSDVNPMEFMKIAEQQRNRAQLRDEANQRLDISRGHLDLARAADLRSQTEANRKEQERQSERELFNNLFGGGTPAGGTAPDQDQRPTGLPDVARSLPDTSGVGFAEPGTATGSPVDQMSSQQLRQMQSRFAPDTTSFKVLQDAYNKALAREQMQQDRAVTADIYSKLGPNPTAEDFDKALSDTRIPDKMRAELEKRRTSAQAGPSASTLKIITKDQDDTVALNDIQNKLREAIQLGRSGNVSTGLSGMGDKWIGRNLGEIASPVAQATARFANITEGFAIEHMSEVMKGATSDREMFANLQIAANAGESMKNRLEALDKAMKRADELKRLKARRIQQLGGGKFEVPGSDEAASSGGGGSSKTRLRFNPATGDFE